MFDGLLLNELERGTLSPSPDFCERSGTVLSFRHFTRGTDPEEPGAAALVVEKDCLHAFGLLHAANPRNTAESDNGETWTTGDVFELFFQIRGRQDYFEAHTTPEGMRLQLHIPDFLTFRNIPHIEKVCDFSLSVNNSIDREKKLWRAEIVIPFSGIGLKSEELVGSRFVFARYSYLHGLAEKPEVTSTRVFEKTAHFPDGWHTLL